MITKPISLSPDSENISVENNQVILTAEVPANVTLEMVGDDSDQCYISLVLRADGREYLFDYNTSHSNIVSAQVNEGTYSKKITIVLDLNQSLYGSCWQKFIGTYNSFTLGHILTNAKEYSWKIRLFENKSIKTSASYVPTTVIAYGSVTGVEWVKPESAGSLYTTILTIAPHTNINDKVVGDAGIIYKDGHCLFDYLASKETTVAKKNNVQTTVYSVLKNVDCNTRYYIRINGKYYPVKYYRFFPAKSKDIDIFHASGEIGAEIDTQSSERYAGQIDKYFDDYGNPLAGYVILNAENNAIQVGDTYQIYCNYVDSSNAFFNIYSEPEIRFRENKNTELNSENASEENPYILTYCNLELKVDYFQNEGIEANYFQYKIYEYNEDLLTYELRYSSGNQYSQKIQCSYDSFWNYKKYKMVMEVVDNAQKTHRRELFFQTQFRSSSFAINATAEYYSRHNSIIVDWSELKSITPVIEGTVADNDYIELNDCGEVVEEKGNNTIVLDKATRITYETDDFNNSLSFTKSAAGIQFKGFDHTFGDFLEFSTSDNFYAKVSYDGQNINVSTNRYFASFALYDDYKLEDVEAALSQQTSTDTVPFLWNNELTWEEGYYFHTTNKISNGLFTLIIDEHDCSLIRTVSEDGNTYKKEEYTKTFKTPVITNASHTSLLSITGDIMCKKVVVLNQDEQQMNPYDYLVDGGDWEWTLGTALLCCFNNSTNGAGSFNDSLSNISGYRVYKTLGEDDTLYEIGRIEDGSTKVLEDFVVGDNCKYTYYIYPIIPQDDGTLIVATPLRSNSIILKQGVEKVFALNQIGYRAFEVDINNVWRLYINLEDKGYTINNDKTFYDTLSTYNQEFVGNRKYITKSISGLIGNIDCESQGEYTDNYDMLTSWNYFVTSPSLKCLIDVRGLVLPGNFESNPSVNYLDGYDSPAQASFNWRQKSDLDIIKIYGKPLSFNPLRDSYLISDDGDYLGDNRRVLLMGNK